MLFNSLEYFIFLPIVYALYWFVTRHNLKFQNGLILGASYFFYGCWDWRFLSLIALSTVVDYCIGLKIHENSDPRVRKAFLWVSVVFNFSLLGFFKYYNFFIDSWIDLLGRFGYEIQSVWTLSIILPVGISFYTFQTVSYSLDIYHKKCKPTKDFIAFAAFVSFFPQLVAGPIERASHFLPQILQKRTFSFEQSAQGLRLILWGIFKKVVIADSLSKTVDHTFMNVTVLGGGELFMGLVYFAFQIYCDFSGYSDVAIGTAKLFGIELMSNFKFPYFSRDIGEFWRRWHISLSSWFRDYLYIPLGGSRLGPWVSIRNIFVIFIVSGFWHGANWTFIVWGFVHASFFIPVFVLGNNRKNTGDICCQDKRIPNLAELFQMGSTFVLTTVAWVFFRSQSLEQALSYLTVMFTKLSIPPIYSSEFVLLIVFIFLDWLWRKNERDPLNIENQFFRWSLYYIMTVSVLITILRFSSVPQRFIYFQF